MSGFCCFILSKGEYYCFWNVFTKGGIIKGETLNFGDFASCV
jgi:hypothetical protein